MGFRITTWNVNGIRNPFGFQPWRGSRTFEGMFDILESDIVIMQELKIQRKDLRDDMVLVPGWDCYFSLPRHKKGYSGVGIYTRNATCAPTKGEEGVLGVLCLPGSTTAYCDLPEDQQIGGYLSSEQLDSLGIDPTLLDSEGRCVVLEFPAFVLMGIYSPANSSGTKGDFRYGFINALDMRIRNLIAMGKNVVVTGDLNVSRDESDTAGAEDSKRKEAMTHEDYVSTPNRRIFNQQLEGGEVIGERDAGREHGVLWDIVRGFHPNRKGMYTHWEQKVNARPGNFGSRIDFILCSLPIKPWFSEANTQDGLFGSDHCPVYATMSDKVEYDSKKISIRDIMSPRGTFECGVRLKEWSVKEIPSLSGKLLQEFDKRRTIKDMFNKKPGLSTAESGDLGVDPQPGSIRPASQGQPPEAATATEPAATQSIISSQASIVDSNRAKKRSVPNTNITTGKRLRYSTTPTSSNMINGGQKSLKGFFAPKTQESSVAAWNGIATSKPHLMPTAQVDTYNGTTDAVEAHTPPPNTAVVACSHPSLTMDSSPVSAEIFDPIVSKDSWSKLFTKPVAPRCDHGDPCKIMKTKKVGFNCGREFWMCQRPLGPSGSKEKNTQWRCGTFIWSSEWNGTADRSP